MTEAHNGLRGESWGRGGDSEGLGDESMERLLDGVALRRRLCMNCEGRSHPAPKYETTKAPEKKIFEEMAGGVLAWFW